MGRSKILLFQSRNAVILAKVAGDPIEGCSGMNCSSTRARYAEILGAWSMAGLLDYFEDNSELYSAEFCPTCRALFKDHCEAASQALWNDLPNLFELPGWTELERLRVLTSD